MEIHKEITDKIQKKHNYDEKQYKVSIKELKKELNKEIKLLRKISKKFKNSKCVASDIDKIEEQININLTLIKSLT